MIFPRLIKEYNLEDRLVIHTSKMPFGDYTVTVGCDADHTGLRSYCLMYETGFPTRYKAWVAGRDWRSNFIAQWQETHKTEATLK